MNYLLWATQEGNQGGKGEREGERERGGGDTECHRVVLTYKQAHALLIYMSRVGLTHTH